MLAVSRGSGLAESAGMKSLALAALTLLAGCELYFSDGDDDDCQFPADITDNGLRNPETGSCEPFGGCDPSCADCAAVTTLNPDWGSCFSACDSLDESTCAGTSGCRVAYTNDFPTDGPPTFRGCWAVAPSGPIQGRQCVGLDAQECSRHDDCSAVYNDHVDDANRSEFAACIDEHAQGCFGDQDCGTGSHCSVSDGDCQDPPGCNEGNGCPDVCFGRCVPDRQTTCANIDCGPGSHCEEHCNEPNAPGCGAVCVPDGNACASTTCPTGTECVVQCSDQSSEENCGVCTVACVALGTCEAIATEAACGARADCRKVFEGTTCECTRDGVCECSVLTYDRCETRP
jgi:hypothetical protein